MEELIVSCSMENGDRILVYNTVDLPSYAIYAYDFSPLDITVTGPTGADITNQGCTEFPF